MKKVMLIFVFFMLASSVLAMDDPIRVRTHPGDEVRVFLWPAEYGPVLNSDIGFADDDGFFTAKTFFSLDADNYTLQVSVFDSDRGKTNGASFEQMNSLSPIFVDCLLSECRLSAPWKIANETVEVNSSNESLVEEVNETVEVNSSNESLVEEVNETVEVNDSIENETIGDLILVGKAIFVKEDGSINLGYSIGGFVLLFALVIFIFIMVHGNKKKRKEKDVIDEDDKELEYMDKKVKDAESKIKKIRDHDAKAKKIEETKAKLAADERELKELERTKSVGDGEKKKEDSEEKDFDVDNF